MRAARTLLKEAREYYRPKPFQQPHVWASENIYIPAGQSINAGFYDPTFFSFQNEILDTIADPKIKQVIFVASSQIGKTQTITTMMAYIIANDPAPILYTRGIDSDAKAFSKNDFMNIIDNCKALDGVFAANRGKEASNTLNEKKFDGGFIKMYGAQSANKLAGYAAKYYFADEIGKYRAIPIYGHPIDLASSRCKTWENYGAKKVYISTPTVTGLKGDIYTLYENLSDMRVREVPCVKCGYYQELVWENVKFGHCKLPDGTYDLREKVYYQCVNEACGCQITDAQRISMLRKGVWRKTNLSPEREAVAGFRISQLYSPLTNLENIVKEWLEKCKDPISRQQFKNETLGVPYDEDVNIRTSAEGLYNKREEYHAEVPYGVGYLNMTVDVQGTPRDEGSSPSYLQYSVTGWGKNWECWLIDHGIIDGSPASPETWVELQKIANKVYQHENGNPITISRVGIDTQGGWTQQTLDFVKGKYPRFLGIFGAKTIGAPLLPRKYTESGHKKVRTWGFGTTNAKDMVYNHIIGNDLIHFPMTLDQEYFRQLFAEKSVEIFNNGNKVHTYKQIRARNEALDLLVYSVGLMAMDNRRGELDALVDSFNQAQTPDGPEDDEGQGALAMPEAPEPVERPKVKPSPRPEPRLVVEAPAPVQVRVEQPSRPVQPVNQARRSPQRAGNSFVGGFRKRY